MATLFYKVTLATVRWIRLIKNTNVLETLRTARPGSALPGGRSAEGLGDLTGPPVHTASVQPRPL